MIDQVIEGLSCNYDTLTAVAGQEIRATLEQLGVVSDTVSPLNLRKVAQSDNESGQNKITFLGTSLACVQDGTVEMKHIVKITHFPGTAEDSHTRITRSAKKAANAALIDAIQLSLSQLTSNLNLSRS